MRWRSKKVLGRKKLALFCTLLVPLLLISFLAVLKRQLAPTEHSWTTSSEQAFVTSSTPNVDTNYFYSESSGYNTSLNLTDCTQRGARIVGLVTPLLDPAGSEDILFAAFRDINQAYKSANDGLELTVMQFNSSQQIDDYENDRDYKNGLLCFSLGFNSFKPTENSFEVELRFYEDWIPQSKLNQPTTQDGTYNAKQQHLYETSGFMQVMATVTSVITKNVYHEQTSDFSLLYVPMNTGNFATVSQPVLTSMGYLIPLAIWAFTILAHSFITQVEEKNEGKVQVIFKRAGMREIVDLIVQFELYSVTSIVLIPIAALVINQLLFFNVDYWLILSIITLFFIEEFLLATMLRYAFGRVQGWYAHASVVVVSIIMMIITQTTDEIHANSVYLFSVLPLVQLQWLSKIIFTLSKLHYPVTANHIRTHAVLGGIQGSKIIWIQFFMAVFFLLALLYVWPLHTSRKSGRKLRWYYPLTRSFWCRPRTINILDYGEDSDDEESLQTTDPAQMRGLAAYQEEPLLTDSASPQLRQSVHQREMANMLLTDSEKQAIERGVIQGLSGNESRDRLILHNLVKKYGKQSVIKKLNLTIFNDQVTAILGHNGSGKSTLMNILNGTEEPTSGDANFLGKDLITRHSECEDQIGVCTQEVILLEKLTVKETLEFFCYMKGVQRPELIIEENLERLNLQQQRDTIVAKLSYVEKRKLQLTIALLGNETRLVLLDEPTTGLDATSRREVWEAINRAKENRIILITTRHLDEAEALADRIAIVSNGSLQCCGNADFLKSRYGTGYQIEIKKIRTSDIRMENLETYLQGYIDMVREPSSSSDGVISLDSVQLSRQASASKEGTGRRELNIQIEDDGTLIYTVPTGVAVYFDEIFAELDRDRQHFNIKSYRVSGSSLEDIFDEIGNMEEAALERASLAVDQKRREDQESRVIDNQHYIYMEKIKPSFCRLLSTQLTARFKGNYFSGNTCCLVWSAIVTFFLTCMVCFSHQNASFDVINYTNVNQFYKHELPLSVVFNSHEATNPMVSTDPLFGSMFEEDEEERKTRLEPIDSTWVPGIHHADDVGDLVDEFYTSVIERERVKGTLYGAYLAYGHTATKDPKIARRVDVVVYSNMKSLGSVPTFGALMLQQVARLITQTPELEINFVSKPLKINIEYSSTINTSLAEAFSEPIFCISFLAVTLMVRRMLDQMESGYYSQLLLRGGTPLTFVLSHYISDLVSHLFIVLQYIYITQIFGIVVHSLWVVGLLWALAEPLFAYTLCYASFRLTGIKKNNVVYILIPMYLIMMIVEQAVLAMISGQERDQGMTLAFFFFPLPVFSFMIAFQAIIVRNEAAIINSPDHLGVNVDPLGEYGAQDPLTFQFLGFIMYVVILLLFIFVSSKSTRENLGPEIPPDEDKGVKKERIRVSGIRTDEILVVKELVKRFTNSDNRASTENQSFLDRPVTVIKGPQGSSRVLNKVVKGISFGVAEGEILTIMGQRGAGKTTALRCIAGLEQRSGGQISYEGIHEQVHPDELHGLIGYCPQTECLDSSLTVRQSLMLFSQLLGVREDLIEKNIEETLFRFGLVKQAKLRPVKLNTVDKRKLQCALAVVGYPKVILIDESNSEIDHIARRQIKRSVEHDNKESVTVFVTNSVDDSEGISTKLAFMEGGQFRCFGSSQEIRDVQGAGFYIEIDLDLHSIYEQVELDKFADESDKFLSDQFKIKNWLIKLGSQLEANDERLAFNFAENFEMYEILEFYHAQYRDGEKINIELLQKEVLLLNTVGNIIIDLTYNLGQAQIVSFEGGHAHFRVKQTRVSSSQVFVYLQSLKDQYPIREFSAGKPSLDQIFKAFATEASFKALNRSLAAKRSIQ